MAPPTCTQINRTQEFYLSVSPLLHTANKCQKQVRVGRVRGCTHPGAHLGGMGIGGFYKRIGSHVIVRWNHTFLCHSWFCPPLKLSPRIKSDSWFCPRGHVPLADIVPQEISAWSLLHLIWSPPPPTSFLIRGQSVIADIVPFCVYCGAWSIIWIIHYCINLRPWDWKRYITAVSLHWKERHLVCLQLRPQKYSCSVTSLHSNQDKRFWPMECATFL